VWECGSAGVRECGSAGVWVCGCVGVWECGSVGVWECAWPRMILCEIVGRPPPRPSPTNCVGEGERRKVHRSGIEFSPFPRAAGERGWGEGAVSGASSMSFVEPRLLTYPTSPSSFWGRWASSASPVGAPADAVRCRSKRIRILPFLPRSGGEGLGERGPCRAQLDVVRSGIEVLLSPLQFGGERPGEGGHPRAPVRCRSSSHDPRLTPCAASGTPDAEQMCRPHSIYPISECRESPTAWRG
jgi:hypothetical protein